MSLTQYAKARVGESLRTWLGTWPMSEFPRVFGDGGKTSTGVPVSEFSALNYSAFWSAVSVIAADVASLPLVLYKRTTNGGKERHTDSKLYELLHDAPNPEMTSMVFRETVQAHAMTWGGGFAEIERDGLDRPRALWPLTPDRVTPFREKDNRGRGGPLQYRVTNSGGGQTILSARNVLHVPGLGFDGTVGYSVVQMARESISLGLATEQFGGAFFGNGSSFGGVISFKQDKLTKEFKDGVRESINSMHTGVDRAHKFLLLGNEAKYDRLGIPPNDAQFLETRKFQITEIARWFQIPPHKLGDLERATFSNIEQQDIEYYRSCLRRWLVRWEQEYTRKLIPSLERKQQFIKHNVEGFLRGDSAARASFYTSMFNIGAYSINMILESEDQNRIGPEGDVHFVQGNLLPADLAMEGPKAPPVVTVEKVPPKELPPAEDEDDDEDDDARDLKTLLSEIAGNTAALQASMAAEREAMSQAERDQHHQIVARLDEERAQLQQQFDTYRAQQAADVEAARLAAETEIRAATDARDAAATVATAASTTAADAERRAADEAMARTQAEAARTAADVAVQETATKLEAQRAQEAERLAGMLAAHRALIVQVMGRVVRRETDRARRHQATPAKLRQWMTSFYGMYHDECVDELRPAIRAHLAWKHSASDVETVTAGLVRDYLAESQRQLHAVLDGDEATRSAALERLLQRWEQDRPTALADLVLHDEVTYLRSLGTGPIDRNVDPPLAPASALPPIHVNIHNHPPPSKSVRFNRSLDGSVESATIGDED